MSLSLGIFLTNIIVLIAVFILASSAALISERTGTINISIEGGMVLGAGIYVLLQSITTVAIDSIFLAIIYNLFLFAIASAVVVLFNMILAFTTINMMSNHVIVGTGMNLLAPALIGILAIIMFGSFTGITYQSPWQFTNQSGNAVFDFFAIICIAIAVAVAIGLAFILNKTVFGLRLKAAGENPYALETAGVSVTRTRYYGLIISGALTGLSGAIYMLSAKSFSISVAGIGFIALGILIFGQWKITGIVLSSILIGTLMALARSWASFGGWTNSLPQDFVYMIPFIIPIIILMIFKNHQGPEAAGKGFRKDERD